MPMHLEALTHNKNTQKHTHTNMHTHTNKYTIKNIPPMTMPSWNENRRTEEEETRPESHDN